MTKKEILRRAKLIRVDKSSLTVARSKKVAINRNNRKKLIVMGVIKHKTWELRLPIKLMQMMMKKQWMTHLSIKFNVNSQILKDIESSIRSKI